MRYIKRVNESNDEIINFIKVCFSELEDDSFVEIDYKTLVIRNVNIDLSRNVCDLAVAIIPNKDSVKGNPYMGTKRSNMSDIINRSNMLNDIYLDVDVAIKRIESKYDINYDILTNSIGDVYVAFYFN